MEQLSSWAITTEPVLYRTRELQLLNPRATTIEACVPYSPGPTTEEATSMRSNGSIAPTCHNQRKALAVTKTQLSQK